MGKKSSAVYNINYHIVWCPKIRRLILVDKVRVCRGTTRDNSPSQRIQERPELCQADPIDSSTNIVKIFKGVTGLRMSRKFQDIESKLWRDVAVVGTAGHVFAETIERYIREQQTDWKRGSSTG